MTAFLLPRYPQGDREEICFEVYGDFFVRKTNQNLLLNEFCFCTDDCGFNEQLTMNNYHTKFQNARHIRSAHRKALITLIYDKGFEKWYQLFIEEAIAPEKSA